MSGCDNSECGTSSDIMETLTFGSGELDYYGYWENPCTKCARAHEEAHPEDAPCWPYAPKDLAEIRRQLGI